ncbi:MAG TPA: hypothetical protein VGA09_12450, partial [Candidatus Binatia bacterium]
MSVFYGAESQETTLPTHADTFLQPSLKAPLELAYMIETQRTSTKNTTSTVYLTKDWLSFSSGNPAEHLVFKDRRIAIRILSASTPGQELNQYPCRPEMCR